ncbi:hypothetical protein CVT26_011960 [Gymnopilus dilepis]|uniref:F-box domain-containing protein n=1 Tax=Gymnopilus dilepis TaxID=231916 RepID=A0A409YHW1_9AGAR|nr:hypothetical protein CVT26_011960 [Gymnopilus dilepis]
MSHMYKPLISVLPQDVLHHVFWLNTDMLEDRGAKGSPPSALTLIRSSHVCSSWRQLILSSPSLWGQVIDFDYLKDRDFRNEVIRRSRQSQVSIMAWDSLSTNAQAADLEDIVTFLEQHWDRVQNLELYLRSCDIRLWQMFEDRIWEVLQRPAHSLAVFFFSPPSDVGGTANQPLQIQFPPALNLFGNRAPQLRRFEAEIIPFSPRAHWHRNIREFYLTGTLLLCDLLLALQKMPLLERLHLDDCSHEANLPEVDLSTLPVVEVPSLKSVEMWIGVEIATPYISFLKHLKPRAFCLPVFCIATGKQTSSDERNLSKLDEFLGIFSAYCGLDLAPTIGVHVLKDGNFRLQAGGSSDGAWFEVNNMNPEVPLYRHYGEAFFPTLRRSAFRFIKEVSLAIEVGDFVFQDQHQIIDFIQQFRSATSLRTSPKSAAFFKQLPPDVLANAFPSLDTIKFTASPEVDEIPSVQAFVRAMRDTGHQIETVSFPSPEYLKEFVGLRPVFE